MAGLLALVSAVAYGAGDFFGGLASRRMAPAAVMLRTNAVGLAGLMVALPFAGQAVFAWRDAGLGAAAA